MAGTAAVVHGRGTAPRHAGTDPVGLSDLDDMASGPGTVRVTRRRLSPTICPDRSPGLVVGRGWIEKVTAAYELDLRWSTTVMFGQADPLGSGSTLVPGCDCAPSSHGWFHRNSVGCHSCTETPRYIALALRARWLPRGPRSPEGRRSEGRIRARRRPVDRRNGGDWRRRRPACPTVHHRLWHRVEGTGAVARASDHGYHCRHSHRPDGGLTVHPQRGSGHGIKVCPMGKEHAGRYQVGTTHLVISQAESRPGTRSRLDGVATTRV